MKRRLILSCLVTLILALVISGLAQAQTGGGYDLTWGTVAGGGATGSANTPGSFNLNDTIGQASTGAATGAGYTLTSGLWSTIASVATTYHVFLPVLLNNAADGRP